MKFYSDDGWNVKLVHLKNSLGGSYEYRHRPAIQSNHNTSRYLLNRQTKNINSHSKIVNNWITDHFILMLLLTDNG